MKANCWFGKKKVDVVDVSDPHLINRQDAIVRVTSTAICGSDLHLYDGVVPMMERGDILGHEFMGEIVETGSDVRHVKVGDRVVVAATISCGKCWSCQHQEFSLCENSNPNAWIAEKMMGHSPAAVFGFSHLTGGFAGGQAQYVRVPFADVGALQVPDELEDEQVLFLSGTFPTGYMAAENCNIQANDTIAVWGCGPVGQFAIRSALLLGAGRVIAIDRVPARLQMARNAGAETIDFSDVDVYDTLMDMTVGRGPDSCIDAVGMEAHAPQTVDWYDRIKQMLMPETNRSFVLRQVILACRNAGTVSVPGVYAGLVDKLPAAAMMNRALTIRTGQTHTQRYMRPLLERIREKDIDPSFVITHRMRLDDAPKAFDMFSHKDGCVKVVLKPWGVPALEKTTSLKGE